MIITLILTSLYGCEKESVNENIKTGDNDAVSNLYENDNLVIQSSGYSNFQSNSSFQNLVSNLNLESSFENYDSNISKDGIDIYGFVVDTSNVKQIINEDYLSYTFRINRTEGRVGLYEDLLIEVKDNEEKAYIVSYIPDQQWLSDIMNGVETEFNGKVRLQEITSNKSNFVNNKSGDCGSYYVYVDTKCSCAGHWPGQACSCSNQPSSVRYTFDYPCPDEGGDYSEGPIGPRGGGGGTAAPNPTPDDTVTSPTGISNSDGSNSELTDLINDLSTIMNEGDSFVLDYTLTDDETLDFDSVQEVDDFFESLLDSEFSESEYIDEIGSIRRDTHSMPLSSFPQASLVASIKVMVPDDNNDLECLEILNATTELEGNNTFFNWVQLDESDPNNPNGPVVTINEGLDSIKISIQGVLKVGLNIDGYPVRTTKLLTVIITYDYSTGVLNQDFSYWRNTIINND
ncbi:hypothetical protein FBALC1_09237 [Flavobacteriales bacterium ALC-1]|nr:hypothetical protein FBALC1_09237 [Flavobacteriales bacterium ALC-1]